MPASPTLPPELIQAHKLLKAAERGDAAKVLKAYLSKNPRDATAWWLMAHAVTRPDNVQTCLERVLAINPDHAKARARLDELLDLALSDEPDDSFFGVSSVDSGAKSAAPGAPAGPPSGVIEHPFLTTPLRGTQAEPGSEPDAPPATSDPFVGQPPSADPFADVVPGSNPFTADIMEGEQPPAPPAAAPADPFAAASDWTAAPVSSTPPAPLVPDAPANDASAWSFSFTDDEAPPVMAAPAAETPAPQPPAPPSAPADPNAPRSPFLSGGGSAAWFSQLDNAAFDPPDAAPSDPNTPAWLDGFDAGDLQASLASTPSADPFAAAPGSPAPAVETPPTSPAPVAPSDPFAAAPDWTTAPVSGTPAVPPAPSRPAVPPVVPDPFAPSAPAASAPDALDPFAGVAGPDDPFADLPPDDSILVGGRAETPRAAAGAIAPAVPPDDVNKRVRRVMIIALLAVAVMLALGGLWVVADQRGMFDPPPPPMTRLDAASFSLDYPEEWDMRCTTESLGYPVCGIANDKLFNQVDYFAGKEVDFAQMFADLGNGLLFGASELPDTQISVIVMDVPRTSDAYAGYSQAKAAYEWTQQGSVSEEAKVTYDQHEMTIDGRTANYYFFNARDPGVSDPRSFGREAIYDVYIEHNGRVLWMTVSMSGPLKADLPTDVIETMIESIRITSAS
ncbi:hypothetical protein [Aggregatilinea lenta]|uniref:hypothetical protein n=1 Tax=Aggregatilinea lenta TaxID=913108 RepID=UPI000E5B6412|nr:hypothetical protein [Aggregatilinea lenta]